jgi:PAS domain S-box-containing protein
MSDNFLAPQKKHKKSPFQSVAWLLAVLIGSVFLIEVLVMLLLHVLPPMPKITSVFLDATLLSTLLFPIFYFLVFQPLVQNITELGKAEDELRVAAVALEIKDPILITDAQANIVRANKMFLNITGYKLEDLVGKNPRIFKSGRHGKAFYEKMWQQVLSHGSWRGEVRFKTQGGHAIPLCLTITAVKNEQQETTHYVAIYNYT